MSPGPQTDTAAEMQIVIERLNARVAELEAQLAERSWVVDQAEEMAARIAELEAELAETETQRAAAVLTLDEYLIDPWDKRGKRIAELEARIERALAEPERMAAGITLNTPEADEVRCWLADCAENIGEILRGEGGGDG